MNTDKLGLKTGVFIACSLCLFALQGRAGDVQVSGPISGVFFDPQSHSIRPVIGMPGASFLGKPLIDNLEMAEIAPNGKVALAVQDGQLYSAGGLDGDCCSWNLIAEAAPKIDRIVWNSDSSAAAVYSSDSRSLIIVPGQTPIGLDGLGGEIKILALDRSARSVILGMTGESGGLYVATADDAPQLILRLQRPGAVQLARQDQDLFVADPDAQQIFELRDFRNAAEPLPFADLPGPGSEPVALAFSADERLLFMADKAARSIVVYDVSSRSLLDQIALDAEPVFLKPFSNASLFLLNSGAESNEPLFILNGGQPPAVYFVPAGRAE